MNQHDFAAKINNPKLTLYAFHLRNNLALGTDEVVTNADHLWQQCEELGKQLKIPRLENLRDRLLKTNNFIGVPPNTNNRKTDYLELLSERSLDFSAIPDGTSLQLRGEVYPLQIHDTFAVDITFRYPYPNLNFTDLSYLNIQGCLSQTIQASLGQTLILFVQPVEKIDDIQAYSNACISLLFPELKAKKLLVSPAIAGQLLGSPIFEYDAVTVDPSNAIHVLVWLNLSSQTETKEETGEYYHPLMNLLCCRSKILYAYTEYRWCNDQARKFYTKLEIKVREFKDFALDIEERLKQFQKYLTELPKTRFDYTCHLRDLELHQITIDTNLSNYKFWLAELKKATLPNDNLKPFEDFLNQAETFKKQIQVDLSYLIPGQKLSEEMITAIRGIVEIEQAERDRIWEEQEKIRDRNLQTTITLVGTGIGVAGVTATAYPYFKKQEPEQYQLLPPFSSPYLHPITESILVSLSIGLVTPIVAWGVIYLIRKSWRNFKEKSNKISSKSSSNNQLNHQNQKSLPNSGNLQEFSVPQPDKKERSHETES